MKTAEIVQRAWITLTEDNWNREPTTVDEVGGRYGFTVNEALEDAKTRLGGPEDVDLSIEWATAGSGLGYTEGPDITYNEIERLMARIMLHASRVR